MFLNICEHVSYRFDESLVKILFLWNRMHKYENVNAFVDVVLILFVAIVMYTDLSSIL